MPLFTIVIHNLHYINTTLYLRFITNIPNTFTLMKNLQITISNSCKSNAEHVSSIDCHLLSKYYFNILWMDKNLNNKTETYFLRLH